MLGHQRKPKEIPDHERERPHRNNLGFSPFSELIENNLVHTEGFYDFIHKRKRSSESGEMEWVTLGKETHGSILQRKTSKKMPVG